MRFLKITKSTACNCYTTSIPRGKGNILSGMFKESGTIFRLLVLRVDQETDILNTNSDMIFPSSCKKEKNLYHMHVEETICVCRTSVKADKGKEGNVK